MRHAQCLITTAEALQQVFNVSVKTPSRPGSHAGVGRRSSCPRALLVSASARRSSTYRPSIQRPEPSYQRSRGRYFEPVEIDLSVYGPKVDRPYRDEEIRVRRAHLKLPNGKLSQPQSLQEILDARAKDEYGKYSQFVQEVAPADPVNGRHYSVLGIFDKKEMKEKELAQKKNSQKSHLKEKSLVLGWSIEGNDLQYRLGRLKAFLEKGNKVEVVLGSTKIRGWGSKRKVTMEEGVELLESFRRVALEVKGTQVIKELEGKVLQQASMSFQGPGKKARENHGEDNGIIEDT